MDLAVAVKQALDSVGELDNLEPDNEVAQAQSGPSDEELAWLEKRKRKLTGSNFPVLMKAGEDVRELNEKLKRSVIVPPEKLNEDGHRKGKLYNDWKKEQTQDAVLLTKVQHDDLVERIENVKPFTEQGFTYLRQKIAEHFGSHYSFTSASVEWGKKYESTALRLYAERMGYEIDSEPFRFITLKDPTSILNGRIGSTPDCMVQGGGCGEVKCRKDPSIHMDTVLTGKVSTKDLAQCDAHMLCTGEKWCDFISFDPTMDEFEFHRLCVIRVHRDEQRLEVMRGRLITAVAYVDSAVEKLRSLEVRRNFELMGAKLGNLTGDDRAAMVKMLEANG